MEEIPTRKRGCSEGSTDDMPEAKRLRAAGLILLDIFDEVDSSDRLQNDTAPEDLDTVLRSFEEEICVSSATAEEQSLPSTSAVSDSDVLQPDLSYLLEASDDELGLPPAVQSSSNDGEPCEGDVGEETKPEATPLAQIWRFDVDFSCFDSLDMVNPGHDVESGGAVAGEFTAGGSLFELPEFPDISWRSESLPAV